MDFEKFTEKAQSAIVDCQNYAISEGHQQLEGEHLHLALVRQDQGLIGRLMDYMGVPKEDVVTELENELAKLPKVQGGQLYASQRFNRLLMDAEKKAREFKDEFVSVEHLYLALLDEKNTSSATVLQKTGFYRNCPRSGEISASPVQTRKTDMRLWKNTEEIWWRTPDPASWIR